MERSGVNDRGPTSRLRRPPSAGAVGDKNASPAQRGPRRECTLAPVLLVRSSLHITSDLQIKRHDPARCPARPSPIPPTIAPTTEPSAFSPASPPAAQASRSKTHPLLLRQPAPPFAKRPPDFPHDPTNSRKYSQRPLSRVPSQRPAPLHASRFPAVGGLYASRCNFSSAKPPRGRSAPEADPGEYKCAGHSPRSPRHAPCLFFPSLPHPENAVLQMGESKRSSDCSTRSHVSTARCGSHPAQPS